MRILTIWRAFTICNTQRATSKSKKKILEIARPSKSVRAHIHEQVWHTWNAIHERKRI